LRGTDVFRVGPTLSLLKYLHVVLEELATSVVHPGIRQSQLVSRRVTSTITAREAQQRRLVFVGASSLLRWPPLQLAVREDHEDNDGGRAGTRYKSTQRSRTSGY